MVNVSSDIEISLGVYPRDKLAVLKIQDQEISNYVFEEYIHYPDTTRVRFLGIEGTETSTVNYDVVRIW